MKSAMSEERAPQARPLLVRLFHVDQSIGQITHRTQRSFHVKRFICTCKVEVRIPERGELVIGFDEIFIYGSPLHEHRKLARFFSCSALASAAAMASSSFFFSAAISS
jgi:hypothetical protein